TQGGRIRVLGGDDIVGHSAHSMVCTRHGNLLSGHFAGGEPPTGLSHIGWCARVLSATDLRPICLAAASALSGKLRTVSHVLRVDVVRRRGEVTVPGPP